MLRSLPVIKRRYWVWLALMSSLALLAYSAFSLPPAWYVPVNLATSVVLLAIANRADLTLQDLGLESQKVASGLRWGLWAGLLVAAALLVGVAIPFTRPLFDDARAGGIGVGLLAYRALVRIPLGTVVLEELAFRGFLLGAWRRVTGDWAAAAASSVAFGLWHIRPALDLLDANDLAGGSLERMLAVAAAVVGTAGAGLVFCWLRLRSASLLAPTLAHVSANSLATLAAFVV